MTRKFLSAAAILAASLTAGAAWAESHAMMAPSGDAEAGEGAFRQCVTCHVVKNDEGETLAGRNGRVGPNLYAIAGRVLGSVEDFRYSSALEAANEAGMVWDEESFVGYVQDPTGWLREALDDSKARSKMAYKVRSEEDAADLYAYLYSLAPPAEAEGAATN